MSLRRCPFALCGDSRSVEQDCGQAYLEPATAVSPDVNEGVDQTSFLLADGGLSNCKFVYYWIEATFAAVRIAEYKEVAAGMSSNDADVVNAGAMTALETYPKGKVFNLYLDPKESHAFLVRKILLSSTFSSAYFAHMATFEKYPPKKQVGGGATK